MASMGKNKGMRRKDREMSGDFGLQVLDRAVYGVLSLSDPEGEPAKVYSIPLSIVRMGNTVYFHSAAQGRKVGLVSGRTPCVLVAVGRVEVPELYAEEALARMASDPVSARMLARRVFTTQYESALVRGWVQEVSDGKIREEVLAALCRKYCPGKEALIAAAVKAGGPRARIYGIEIGSITAKRKWYGADGEEMKGDLFRIPSSPLAEGREN